MSKPRHTASTLLAQARRATIAVIWRRSSLVMRLRGSGPAYSILFLREQPIAVIEPGPNIRPLTGIIGLAERNACAFVEDLLHGIIPAGTIISSATFVSSASRAPTSIRRRRSRPIITVQPEPRSPPEWSALKQLTAERDGGCLRCGYAGKGLVAHHINSWALHLALRFDPDNIATLCRACHYWVHGASNPKREFLA